MSEGRIPELWVVVTRAPNGVTHTWGPYLSVRAANLHRRYLMGVLSYDQGVSLGVCRVLNPRPLLNVVSRSTEVNVYDIEATEAEEERGFTDTVSDETAAGNQSAV